MARRSSALLPRCSIPLVLAVGAFLWPVVASAGNPAPDPTNSTGAPAPDPSPAAPSKLSPRSAAIVVRTVLPNAVSSPRVVLPAAPAVRRVHAIPAVPRTQKHAVPREAEVVDVPPAHVDLHPELGAVGRSLPDDSMALLAGIALLVAAVVATSAIALTVVAARPPRSAT
jgi:hypothetical protein